MSRISKQTIDIAGQMYDNGGMPWSEVANAIFDMGHVDSSGNKIHNRKLCIEVTKDPQWKHLKKLTYFSTKKRLAIMSAMRKANISETQITEAMKNLPL